MSKPTKEFYLKVRPYFIMLGYKLEVNILDNYYNLILLYSKEGVLLKIY